MSAGIREANSYADSVSHDRIGAQRLVVFIMCSALFALSQFYRVSNAIMAPQLQHDLSLSPEGLGLLSAVFFYAFAATQIPLALCLDHLGARQVMAALTLIGSIGGCIFATAHDLRMASIGRALLGLGMAGNLMGAMKLFTQWFSPREFATLSGLLVALGSLGNVAASSPLALLMELTGWRWAIILVSILTALLALLFYMTVGERRHPGVRTSPVPTNHDLFHRVRTLLAERDYWLISCGAFFRYGTFVAIQGLWAGPYLLEHLRLPAVKSGNIIMLASIGYIIGCPLGGFISDKVLTSRKYVAAMGLAGMALAELSLTVRCDQPPMLLLAATFLTLGIAAGFGNVVYAHIKGVMPSDMTGMALAGINFFTMLGAGAYIHAMGWVMDLLETGNRAGMQGYQAAFSLGLAGVALAAGLYLFTHESKEWKTE